MTQLYTIIGVAAALFLAAIAYALYRCGKAAAELDDLSRKSKR